jgi:hypothetical protein
VGLDVLVCMRGRVCAGCVSIVTDYMVWWGFIYHI